MNHVTCPLRGPRRGKLTEWQLLGTAVTAAAVPGTGSWCFGFGVCFFFYLILSFTYFRAKAQV